MPHYAGLDVSLKEISICVVDDRGAVVARGSVRCEPEAVTRFLSRTEIAPDRIVHESGQLSIWLQRQLEGCGLPIICIDARMAHKALSARLNKSDKADAEGLAQLARTGWFTPVHIPSEDADRLRTMMGVRTQLIRQRRDIESYVRGVLKTFGVRMGIVTPSRHRANFREQLIKAAEADPVLAVIAEGVSSVHETLCMAAAELEDELRAIAGQSGLVRRLMTVPGVGPMVALGFVATVDDPSRFRRATDVGAFLGLTPRRFQSGDVDRSGRISKCGDREMRSLLFEAAVCLIRIVKRFSSLKSWAVRLAARKGQRKAAVATARKLAVLLLTIWKDGTEFEWTKEARA